MVVVVVVVFALTLIDLSRHVERYVIVAQQCRQMQVIGRPRRRLCALLLLLLLWQHVRRDLDQFQPCC